MKRPWDANPSYEAVCGGMTGHAEVVQLAFDPTVVSYREILMVFFGIHNPTTLNQQGNDVGTQYRSAIFTHSSAQADLAKESIAHLTKEGIFNDSIVTEVVQAQTFFPAEQYHQEYFNRNPHQGYCAAVVSPKVAKFRNNFVKLLKD